jgi:hypothetical protein
MSLSLKPRFMFKRPCLYIYFKAKKCTWNLKVLFSGEPADCINNQHWSETGLPDGFFKPEFSIWLNFWGPWIGKCWYILRPFWIFYGHLGYFCTICCILRLFGTFFRFWCHITRKIWQPWSGTNQNTSKKTKSNW